MGTQQKLLQSRSLARRVIQTLKASGQPIPTGQDLFDVAQIRDQAMAWIASLFNDDLSASPGATGPALTEEQSNARDVDAQAPISE